MEEDNNNNNNNDEYEFSEAPEEEHEEQQPPKQPTQQRQPKQQPAAVRQEQKRTQPPPQAETPSVVEPENDAPPPYAGPAKRPKPTESALPPKKKPTKKLPSEKREKYSQYASEYLQVKQDLKAAKDRWAGEVQAATQILSRRPGAAWRGDPSKTLAALPKKRTDPDRLATEAELVRLSAVGGYSLSDRTSLAREIAQKKLRKLELGRKVYSSLDKLIQGKYADE